MKKLVLTVFSFGALLCLTSCAAENTNNRLEIDQEPPNVVLILVDDLGIGDLSSYGQSILETPNIDQLGKEGVTFHNFYTGAPVCAPSRASLLTGLHTGHVSVRGNKPDQLLGDNELTIAKVLKNEGYKTGIIGKWGVGHPPPPDDPQRKGFDYSYGYINMWHAHNFYPEFLYRNGKKEFIEGNKLARNKEGLPMWAEHMPEGTGVAEVKGQHTHELFEADALNFIERNKDDRFFLYLALNMPHANNEHPEDGMEVPTYGKYENMDWPQPEKGFAQMVTMIDETVGKINGKLIELGIDENTLVIFMSDNGPHQEGFHQMEFFDSNGKYKGMKRDLYEGGVKTPFLAKWPRKIKGGTNSDHVAAFWDFLPTFCDLTGAELPERTDGISFLPSLIGEKDNQKKHEYLYWEFYELGGRQAVLVGNYKGVVRNVRTGSPTPFELYDLSKDPEELNNIADAEPDLVATIKKYMEEAHKPMAAISLFSQDVNAETGF